MTKTKTEALGEYEPKKFPATLGDCIDLAFTMREERKIVESYISAQKKDEQRLEDHIFRKFTNAEIDSARGKLATASRSSRTGARLDNPEKFFEWVAKGKHFEFLHRRVTTAPCIEYWDAKKVVPGVEPFVEIGLSITKRK